ncbi:MAG: hypothetical protein QNJ36_13265 [Calothrix sp. MO_167.B42]|nr:hypothetical protein [Calothrix sp. MO_167.B42]
MTPHNLCGGVLAPDNIKFKQLLIIQNSPGSGIATSTLITSIYANLILIYYFMLLQKADNAIARVLQLDRNPILSQWDYALTE